MDRNYRRMDWGMEIRKWREYIKLNIIYDFGVVMEL